MFVFNIAIGKIKKSPSWMRELLTMGEGALFGSLAILVTVLLTVTLDP
jgi:hypothetical protein